MMTHKTSVSLLTFCAVLALASSVPLSYASNDHTAIYTTEASEKTSLKESKQVDNRGGNAFVSSGSIRQASPTAAAPLFSVSLEPKGKATVSQSYSSPEVVTYYTQWKQSGGNIVVTFSPEDGKQPISFSRSGGKLTATGWNASEWGGKPAPSMRHDSSDPQPAAASSGHRLTMNPLDW